MDMRQKTQWNVDQIWAPDTQYRRISDGKFNRSYKELQQRAANFVRYLHSCVG